MLTHAVGNFKQPLRHIIAGQALHPFCQFTRASTATQRESSSSLSTVAIDVPRFSYSDVYGRKAYLHEGQRTNLIDYSRLNSGWGSNGASIIDDALISPDGTQNAAEVTTGTSAFSGFFKTSLDIVNGEVYSFSVFLKHISGAATSSKPRFETGFTSAFLIVDTTDGSIISEGSGVDSYKVVDYGNGWFRYEITATATSTTLSGSVSIYDGDSVNGGVYGYWGAQLEQAAFASSYISTDGATASRAADVLTVGNIDTPAGFGFLVDLSFIGESSNEGQHIINFNDSGSDKIILYKNTSSNSLNIFTDAVTDGFDQLIVDVTSLDRIRMAVRVESGNTKVYYNGIEVVSATLQGRVLDFSTNSIRVGNNSSGTRPTFAHYKDIMYFSFAPTNAQLQAMSAL